MRKLLILLAALVGSIVVAQNQLEIFSWWAGDEGPALEALIEQFNADHPDIEVINATVTGGAGVNARAVLKTRMLGGDPPDSFQVHAGQELIGTWVVAERMEDLTDLFTEQVIAAGRCDGATAQLYARGRVVVWTANGKPAPATLEVVMVRFVLWM